MSHAAAVRDLKASLNTNQYAKSIAQLKNLATIGNSAACEIYGDMLMEGVWNTYQMKVDGIANKLIGAYDFQGKDPYLLLPRDPVAAIDYYKKASGNRDTARAKLAYCKKMGYAGLPKQNKIDSSVKITSEMKEFLDKNAKSATAVDKNDLEASDKFVPLPDRRPKVQDPATSMFRKMAEYWGYRIFQVMGFGVLTFGLPLMGHAVICLLYAEPKALPLCSCNELQAAYANSIKGYETVILKTRAKKTPFETTSFYIRNLHKFKQGWMWFVLIVSLIFFMIFEFVRARLSEHADAGNVNLRIAIFLGAVVLPFVFVTIWEKRVKEIPRYCGISTLPLSIYLIFLYLSLFFAPWTLFDSDCCHEFEISEMRTGFEKDILNLEE